MKPNMIKLCKIKDLENGDFFLRGRWLYRMSNAARDNLQAQRCKILAHNKIEILKEKKVDARSEVTLVTLPDTCELTCYTSLMILIFEWSEVYGIGTV